ncbi:ABC transporter permease subunit [Sphingomonas sp. IC-11]|uniref:ABC transporter permease subunit n=1 Tax=Sphingomonas sp. IC-11 TaxID=2898528 RepID=UPI001E4F7C74|nr:ABC transporter permease subunit [Sphingomonas sp. IC-11]MCD2316249.1 ABC transporter permease subunit [Sphingomonas sp. IC-11]
MASLAPNLTRADAPAAPHGPSRASSPAPAGSWFARARWTPAILPVLLLATWQLASTTGALPATILPAPTAVIDVGGELIRDGTLIANLGVSAARALVGLLAGGTIALALGLATALSPGLRRLLDPTLQAVRTIPHLALIPLVILWFGIDEGAKILLVGWGVFFPIYLNTYHGVTSVDPGLIEMGRVYGMRRMTLFRRVILPGALPSILVGLRFALGIMWLTLIVAETIAANSGIGYMANQAREFSQTDVIVLAILVYACLGKLADSITRLIERRFLRWNPAYGVR